MIHRSFAAVFAALVAVSVLPVDARAQAPAASLGTQGLGDDDVSAIKAMIDAWTKDFATGDVAGWETYWTSDAVLAPPGSDRLVGKSQIAGYMKANFKDTTGYAFSDWSVAGRKDLAVVTNTVTLTKADGDVALNQMIVLRAQSGGKWRVQSVLYTPTE